MFHGNSVRGGTGHGGNKAHFGGGRIRAPSVAVGLELISVALDLEDVLKSIVVGSEDMLMSLFIR